MYRYDCPLPLVLPSAPCHPPEKGRNPPSAPSSTPPKRSLRLTVGPSSISGLENLLPPDAAAVYVANHNSMVDIALFYKIGMGRRFAWVSKSTVFLVPGVGLIMRLSKYVALTRGSRDSIKQMFDACKKSLSVGWPVAIFPQGTRRRHKFLDFKDGAFKLAIESGVPLVRIPQECIQFVACLVVHKITVRKHLHREGRGAGNDCLSRHGSSLVSRLHQCYISAIIALNSPCGFHLCSGTFFAGDYSSRPQNNRRCRCQYTSRRMCGMAARSPPA
ncbi:unnamed protein product [Phaeothamnion confervicola]